MKRFDNYDAAEALTKIALALAEAADRINKIDLAEPRPHAPARYVTVRLAATMTGFSEKAIRQKISMGKWLEGREYRRTPDGRIMISMKDVERWIERWSK